MKAALAERREYHSEIVRELFPDENHPFHKEFDGIFGELEERLDKPPTLNYDYDYDQLICYGELLSTTIISHFLNHSKVPTRWLDN